MQVAFLEKVPGLSGNNAKMLMQTAQSNPGDKVAILKARTLLSFLWMHSLLKADESGFDGWIMFCGPTSSKENVDLLKNFISMGVVSARGDTIDAVIGMVYGKPSWEQPGLIAIKNDIETKSVFINSFLNSSQLYLKRHQSEEEQLLSHFDEHMK